MREIGCFLLGGYHSAYDPPAWYPTLDRLQIQWDLGGGLMVTGQAYFAITPKVCMGGGLLQAVLSAVSHSAIFHLNEGNLISL